MTTRWLGAVLLSAMLATTAGCRGMAGMAPVFAGIGAATMVAGAAQAGAFRLDRHAAREADERYPIVLRAIERDGSWFPPP